jgi:hypothetical protein
VYIQAQATKPEGEDLGDLHWPPPQAGSGGGRDLKDAPGSHASPSPTCPGGHAGAAGYLARPRWPRSPTAGTCSPGAISAPTAKASPHPSGQTFSSRSGRQCTASRRCNRARAAPFQPASGRGETMSVTRLGKPAAFLAAPGLSGPAAPAAPTASPQTKRNQRAAFPGKRSPSGPVTTLIGSRRDAPLRLCARSPQQQRVFPPTGFSQS